jgi:tRNA-2-methylthio-N6-dimethylallyladenosine synthase
MRYFIKTFGCQMNASDSERVAGFLEARGLKPAKNINAADLVILNTCGIRQMAEDRAYGFVHNLRKSNSEIRIIITGCLANRKDVQRRLKDKVDLFFPINEFEKFGNWIIKNLLKIENCKLKIPAQPDNINCSDYLSISPKYSEAKSAYVPVMTGCNNFCSYCVVPYARGREVSRPEDEIISEIDSLAKNGYKEITLLGQNVNSYNYYRPQGSALADPWGLSGPNVSFPNLLNFLAQSYPKINFKFLTSHPKDFSDELIAVIAENKNISREIHLPVQAGSDKIIRVMNRPYTRKKYLDLIKKIQKKIPGASFTTDVIVGFPGETEKDFQETIKVFEQVKYNEAYINKYSPRPGTAAEKLGDPIAWSEKKRREKILREIVSGQSAPKLKRESGLSAPDKIIVILGPTSSGKSDIAIALAKKFNGEIISADSRQVYRGLDIGTGKVRGAWSVERGAFISEGVPHYAIDIVSPRTDFNAAKFKTYADKIITDIIKRGKTPILCGGTGFWIKAIVDNVSYPEVKPDWELRNQLRNKTAEELFSQLEKLDPARAKTIDAKNPVRLIRAIEICQTIGKVPRLDKSEMLSPVPEIASLQIGIALPKEKLYERIRKRLQQRFAAGMIEEVKNLHEKNKLSWKKIGSFGLGYFWIPKFLKSEIGTKEELFEKIYQAEKDYAKRQMTWFKKDQRIKWLEKYSEIEKEIKKFIEL